jgi:hypothetical protein
MIINRDLALSHHANNPRNILLAVGETPTTDIDSEEGNNTHSMRRRYAA